MVFPPLWWFGVDFRFRLVPLTPRFPLLFSKILPQHPSPTILWEEVRGALASSVANWVCKGYRTPLLSDRDFLGGESGVFFLLAL